MSRLFDRTFDLNALILLNSLILINAILIDMKYPIKGGHNISQMPKIPLFI